MRKFLIFIVTLLVVFCVGPQLYSTIKAASMPRVLPESVSLYKNVDDLLSNNSPITVNNPTDLQILTASNPSLITPEQQEKIPAGFKVWEVAFKTVPENQGVTTLKSYYFFANAAYTSYVTPEKNGTEQNTTLLNTAVVDDTKFRRLATLLTILVILFGSSPAIALTLNKQSTQINETVPIPGMLTKNLVPSDFKFQFGYIQALKGTPWLRSLSLLIFRGILKGKGTDSRVAILDLSTEVIQGTMRHQVRKYDFEDLPKMFSTNKEMQEFIDILQERVGDVAGIKILYINFTYDLPETIKNALEQGYASHAWAKAIQYLVDKVGLTRERSASLLERMGFNAAVDSIPNKPISLLVNANTNNQEGDHNDNDLATN